MSLKLLWEAMTAVDAATGQPRGCEVEPTHPSRSAAGLISAGLLLLAGAVLTVCPDGPSIQEGCRHLCSCDSTEERAGRSVLERITGGHAPVAVASEPASWAATGLGLACGVLVWLRRRR